MRLMPHQHSVYFMKCSACRSLSCAFFLSFPTLSLSLCIMRSSCCVCVMEESWSMFCYASFSLYNSECWLFKWKIRRDNWFFVLFVCLLCVCVFGVYAVVSWLRQCYLPLSFDSMRLLVVCKSAMEQIKLDENPSKSIFIRHIAATQSFTQPSASRTHFTIFPLNEQPSVYCQIVNWGDCQFGVIECFASIVHFSKLRLDSITFSLSFSRCFGCSFICLRGFCAQFQSQPHRSTSSQKVHRDNNNRTQFIWK